MLQYRMLFVVPLFLANVFAFCTAARCQTNKTFPTDDEIKLVMTQTDRALSEYTTSVALEVKTGASAEDLANDKRVLDALKIMSKGISAQPQKFNSGIGFEFILLLDDASRNSALCNGDAIQKGVKVTLGGNRDAAEQYLQLAQACTSVSTLFYTVSENAGALYQRYVDGEESLATDAFNEMNKCIGLLKQKSK